MQSDISHARDAFVCRWHSQNRTDSYVDTEIDEHKICKKQSPQQAVFYEVY